MQDIDMQNKPLTHSIHRQRITVSVCAALLLLAACGEKKQKPAAPPPPEVEVAAVVEQTIPITMGFSATIKALKKVDIIPHVSGYIEARYFTEGDYVQAGDPLYLIDPKPFQARLDAAEAALKKDQASLKLWKSEAARYTRLAKQGAGSVEDKEKAIAHFAEAGAAIEKDRADIDTAKIDLGYTHISAPLTGRIQQTRINVGQLVRKQQDVLTTLLQVDPIYAVFNASRAQSYEVLKLQRKGLGMQKLDQFKASIKLSDGSEYSDLGTLDYISARVNPSTDTVEARAIFPNPHKEGYDADLITGQYVPLTLTVGHRPDTLLIPQPALIQSQAGTHVYVVGQDNKVEHRKVTIGGAYKHSWIIEKGLSKGEKVIVQGVQKVKQGTTVAVVKPGASTEKAASKKPSSS
jgi:membrane fusion protein (multidrug efflux system)